MDRIVECVPNFSEGRNQATRQALIDAVASVTGVRLLDHTMDYDHHRSVLTIAGEPEALVEDASRFILRGIGMNDAAIAAHITRNPDASLLKAAAD